MLRIPAFLSALLLVFSTATAEEPKAPLPPATPQQSAERYFAAMVSDKSPSPPPMMVARNKMTPDQTANHARMVAVQLKDKTLKPDVLVVGKTLARVISSEVTYSSGDKSVVYIDLEKEGDAWLVADVNCLVATERKNIIQGFKELKDPKAVVSQAK